MQHRRLRLGDILDDYCPRERRITNHAIVAIVGDEVKQTRCTTCDADHEYKQARIPSARRKRLEGAVPGAAEGTLRPRTAAGEEDEAVDQPGEDEALLTEDDEQEAELQAEDAGVEAGAEGDTETAVQAEGAEDTAALVDEAAEDEERPAEDDGPVHRRLIRATLPRPEGQMPERKEPEFTIRQPGGRPGGRGRPGGGRGPQRPGGGGQPRFGQGGGGPRQGGGGQGQGQGRPFGSNRPGAPGGHRGGGRPGGPGGQGGQGQGQGQGRGGGGRKRGR